MHERLGDATAIQSVIASCLPQRARWLLGDTPLDFSFYGELHSLAVIITEEVTGDEEYDAPIAERPSDFIVFGELNYSEGGGARPWLVVRRGDGKVFGVDVERDLPLFLLNSSLQAFIKTFHLLDEYLGHGQPIPADLNSSARNVDPTVYSESFWHLLFKDW